MRKHLLYKILIFGIMCVLFSGLAHAQVSVRVGYIDYDGFIEPGLQGGFSGYGTEYLDKISKQTGWRYLYLHDTWENCLRKLEKGEIDLLCTAQYTPGREKLFDYSRQSAGVEYGILYVHPDNRKIFFNDYDSFDGMRVGLLRDSFQTSAFTAYAKDNEFSFIPQEYSTDEAMTQALNNGDVDAIAAGSLARKTDLKPVAKFSMDEFYFITTKGNHEIMDALNQAMESIKLEDPYFDAQLYEKYYGNSVIASQPMFTREEAEFIHSISKLRVAYRSDWFPFEYSDTSGFPKGVTIEIMKKLSNVSDITFEFVPYPSKEILKALDDPSIDLLSSQCVLQNSDPTTTEPYLELPIRVIGNIDNTGLSNHSVLALDKNSAFLSEFLLQNLPAGSAKYYDNLDGCLAAVMQKQVDFTVSGNFVINQIIQKNKYQNLGLVSPRIEHVPLCFRISPSAPTAVRSLLDKSIAFLSEETKSQALREMDTTYTSLYSLSFWEKHSYSIVIVCVIIFLFVCGAALVLYFSEKKKLEFAATHDILTNCFTGEQFKKEAAAKLHCNGIQDYYIVKFDVLHLKYVNQKYGTKTGDLLLQSLTEYIHKELNEQELLGRIIDDNFAALILSENVTLFQQDMHYEIQKIKVQLKIDTPIIIKIGAYKIHDALETVGTMLDKAAVAHKKTKLNPKLDILVYNDSLYQQLLAESQIESEMLPALINGEFQIYLQPQISLNTMRIAAAEALIRWVHPDGSVVEPGKFIPLFERNGFVERIDFYVLEQVCKWLHERLSNGLSSIPVSVNQSRFLLANPEYVHDVEQILSRYDIPRDMIALELTESMCLENADLLVNTMEKLRDLQVQLSIDDFGSGYSSLNLLSEIPSDELKIDRGFLGGSTGSISKRQIIAKVVELAKSLHIRVVCEGVETKEQESFLKSVHCDLVQGFLYSRPIPLPEFEMLLDSGWNFENPLAPNMAQVPLPLTPIL